MYYLAAGKITAGVDSDDLFRKVDGGIEWDIRTASICILQRDQGIHVAVCQDRVIQIAGCLIK